MKDLKFRPLEVFRRPRQLFKMALKLTNNCRYYFISVFAGFTRCLLPFISHVCNIFVFLLGTLASRLFFACFYTTLFRPLCSTRARSFVCVSCYVIFYWVSPILFYPGVCFLPGSASSSFLFFFPQLSVFFTGFIRYRTFLFPIAVVYLVALQP